MNEDLQISLASLEREERAVIDQVSKSFRRRRELIQSLSDIRSISRKHRKEMTLVPNTFDLIADKCTSEIR